MHGFGLDGTRGWAQGLWDMLNDQGVWGIPRSGLVYRKDEADNRFVLTGRMPWEEGMPFSAVDLTEAQRFDHEGITAMFAAIGVEVTDETHSIGVLNIEV